MLGSHCQTSGHLKSIKPLQNSKRCSGTIAISVVCLTHSTDGLNVPLDGYCGITPAGK